uniref:Uncharacterized protein n=1 Tax=viral metagenome TaxID=1070528 RepID=A0A6H1ZP04_9ZZZZ
MKIYNPITEFAEALADVEALQNAMATGIRYPDEGLIDLSKVPVAALTVLCSSHGEGEL